MTDQADLFAQFSNALATRAEAAKNAIVAVRLAHGRHITGMVWRSEIVVVSEQSLPGKDDFELVAAGGAVVTASMAGRDPATNIAILRLAGPRAAPSIAPGATQPGAPARGGGSSLWPVPNGIPAAAASLTGASCSIFGLPAARRADRFSTSQVLIWACRPLGRAAR